MLFVNCVVILPAKYVYINYPTSPKIQNSKTQRTQEKQRKNVNLIMFIFICYHTIILFQLRKEITTV